MESFKIKSIEEFDLEFVEKFIKKADDETASLIPDIAKNNAEDNYEEEIIDFADQPEENAEPKQENEFNNQNIIYAPVEQEDTYEPFGSEQEVIHEETNEMPKKNVGILIGKIAAIVLLIGTIVVFVLGCFVTIFLDNNGSDLAGMCFNTVRTDTFDSTGELIVSKGDLIISNKAEPSEYTPGRMIIVKSNATLDEQFSDIHIINSVVSVTGTSAELVTTNLASPADGVTNISSENTYGLVNSYIFALGNLLHFAIDNAILVCALFVLLAALWCLLLVLLENINSKSKKKK